MELYRVTDPRDSTQLTRAYFDQILIEPRYLDSVEPDLSVDLFGHRFASPIMICAFSHLGKTHAGGMAEMARGAASAGICNWAGMGDEAELRSILDACPGTVKIVKPYADRDHVFRMLKFAEEAGAIAVGIDIDHSFDWRGHSDCVLGETMKPVTLEELKAFVASVKIPFIVKGVLSVQDAVKCREAGVYGVVISHHHGIMPCAVPPLMALPAIREAAGDMELYVDCSVDTGEDAFKCLALGAKAVCVGRAVLKDFAADGAEGVRRYVEHMNDTLRAMMARTCSPTVAQIPHDVLWNASTGAKLR